MALKLVFLILSVALTGASLLSVRQQRVQAVHEMTMHLQRAERTERTIWRARADLAEQITPSKIRALIAHKAETSPVFDDFCPPGTLVTKQYFIQAGLSE